MYDEMRSYLLFLCIELVKMHKNVIDLTKYDNKITMVDF